MSGWALVVGFNLVTAASYLSIAGFIVAGLARTRQLGRNRLAVATAVIFLTCAAHHVLHALDLVGGSGADQLSMMRESMGSSLDVTVTAATAVAGTMYLGLRRSYGLLLRSPSMFDHAGDTTYRQLVANLPHTVVFVVDLELRFVLVEGAELAEAGYDARGMEGRLLADAVPPQVLAELEPHYRGAVEGRASEFDSEDPVSGRVFHSRARPLLDSAGRVVGGLVLAEDVTAVRRATRELARERSRLAEAQRLGQLGSFTLTVATGHFEFSPEMYRIWGLPEGADLAGRRLGMIHPEDRAAVTAHWAAALVAGGRHSTGYRITRPDGATRHLRVELDVDLDERGVAQQVRGTHLDVTELAVARLEATEAGALLSAVLTATPDFTFVTDVRTGAVVYAPPGKNLLGITSEALMQHGAGVIAALVHPEDQDQLRAVNAEAANLADGAVLQLRYRVLHVDGSWHWLSRRVTPFRRDAVGTVVEVLGVVRDVTDLVEAESRLRFSALHDPLTGLPNRALLMDRLQTAVACAERTGRDAVVLFCDLDGFKKVNDTGGHAAGDVVLTETARRISAVLREHDTLARIGGDEFVIVVEPWRREGPDGAVDERVLAVELAERLTVAVREPIDVGGTQHVVTASIGITYAGTTTTDVDQVLDEADAAMYRAKHSGKDRYEIHEHELRTQPAKPNTTTTLR